MRKEIVTSVVGCLAILVFFLTFPALILADCPDEQITLGGSCYEVETLMGLVFALEREAARHNVRASELMELGYEDEAMENTDRASSLDTEANDLRLLVEDLREQPLIVEEMLEKNVEGAVEEQSKLRVSVGADSYEVDDLMQAAEELEEEATELNAKASELMEEGEEDEALEYTDQALELETQANDLRLGVEDLLAQSRVEPEMADKMEKSIE